MRTWLFVDDDLDEIESMGHVVMKSDVRMEVVVKGKLLVGKKLRGDKWKFKMVKVVDMGVARKGRMWLK